MGLVLSELGFRNKPLTQRHKKEGRVDDRSVLVQILDQNGPKAGRDAGRHTGYRAGAESDRPLKSE